ncbi:P-loop containing nucleoside triphosphate hydrolase protein [Xylariales sp. PMI_506]|nr:P-loop containing nucleoside triphosphate hydrolase protein [Xylariales sp. PMI_506]
MPPQGPPREPRREGFKQTLGPRIDKPIAPVREGLDERSRQLDKFFFKILNGTRKLQGLADARRFLEAICNEHKKSECVERLASTETSRKALHQCLTFDTSALFVNKYVENLFCYLSDPLVKAGCVGETLRQVVGAIVVPPLFWNALLSHAKDGLLEPHAEEGFAWLLLQLVHLPSSQDAAFRAEAEALLTADFLGRSRLAECQSGFEKVKFLLTHNTPSTIDADLGKLSPGGRHNNDFVNYRDISILPTRSELESDQKPFLQPVSSMMEVNVTGRAHAHLDSQYRLLREDMLEEFRDDLRRVMTRTGKGPKQSKIITGLVLENLNTRSMKYERSCTMVFRCAVDILNMPNVNQAKRKKELMKTPSFLKHDSLGCILQNGKPVACATVDRNEDLLAQQPPRICLFVLSKVATKQVLLASSEGPIDFVLVPTALFAYKPILERLQMKDSVELDHDILVYSKIPRMSPFTPTAVVNLLDQADNQLDLKQSLGIAKSVYLDQSQIEAVKTALTYQVASIQGPPGTGKSLVGAIITHILLKNTDETILVLAYTNHALCQFLSDLIEIGVDKQLMVRLGKKTSRPDTECLRLDKQTTSIPRTQLRSKSIYSLKDELSVLEADIEKCFNQYIDEPSFLKQVLLHLEFSDTDSHFFEAFSIPETEEGLVIVGPDGRPLRDDYLLWRWTRGNDAGFLTEVMSTLASKDVWNMSKKDRQAKIQQWREQILGDKITNLATVIETYNRKYTMLRNGYKEKTEQILSRKRLIGCTTTAASIYNQEIQAAKPGIIIVEEAGEILEPHIIAAMGPNTQQLIQIGDHKQLRPKVNNYGLTVESGKGYDFNRSMFERLVMQERPFKTLLNQHRMRPEISELIRHNYPDLQDATETENRPSLRGFQQDIVFVDHQIKETKQNSYVDKLDENASGSKQNKFEAEMVLKCVRYLGQQGYRTQDLVILTPYLGQLSLLRNMLSGDHDPVLSDLDCHDLVDAGLMTPAAAKIHKKSIKISTIDNYQGEEADIVIASLTRSNSEGDIGFMRSPERLNVLISRARNALILIGSSETFLNAKKGSEEWARLLHILKTRGRVFDGFPLRCEKHPQTTAVVRKPDDFDIHCPDGGCGEPCPEMLSCGTHRCPSRCHIRIDHSRMTCEAIQNTLCPKKHRLIWRCADKKPPPCLICRAAEDERRRKERRAKKLEDDRAARQLEYAKKLQDVDDKIASERQRLREKQEDATRQMVLSQRENELAKLVKENQATSKSPELAHTACITSTHPQSLDPTLGTNSPTKVSDAGLCDTEPVNETSKKIAAAAEVKTTESKLELTEVASKPFERKESAAEKEWLYMKQYNGDANDAIDKLMEMIGLESVKKSFLSIKVKVDTVVRQDVSLEYERLSAALLGNPGTGKTTVARLYGKFLSSVGVIPGDHFEETTGSRLANDGIQGCQALIDKILQDGGGVFFLDEAYQIVSGSSMGGKQVLDFLLAEIENLRGKIVFVFAGYRKQMEEFFAHNPGIPSRIPVSLNFHDYEDEELLRIMNFQMRKKFNDRLKIEGGSEGLYMRVVARRISRGRGRDGFGNAREVENVLSRIHSRQADRLADERRKGSTPDDLVFLKADLLGPEPRKALASNKDWQKLQDMIGLKEVKRSVQVLVDRLQTNYERELKEQPPIDCSLNKVFLGSPGTGKTTVAKLYGGILVALGLLSNGEIVVKNPADFVGGVLGQSEKNTKAILESTKGKVLIIDEAYMLAGDTSENGGVSDPYKTAVVDTIVAEVQSTAIEDRCVLLLGYSEQMEAMFRKVNPGLSRRFPVASGFVFEDYNADELREILNLKLRQQGFRMADDAKKVVLEVLERARHKSNFGNAGEVDIVLDRAKDRQQKRLSEHPGPQGADVLIPEDVDPDFNRGERAVANVRVLFEDVIGCEGIVEQLEGYQQAALNSKASGIDPREVTPFSFLFRGPPGTGKTSTARKMGQIYYDMGFLAKPEVVDCSATDLIGQYLGQTGPKVQKKFDEALGKILFIDEAYRLGEGHYAKEAMDEMVDCLTKPRYHNKLVVILAGYNDDINRLMAQNPGLTRRFPEAISFSNLPPAHCRELLVQCLGRHKLDLSEVSASSTFEKAVLDRFATLCETPSWGNAGDVHTVAKNVLAKVLRTKRATPSMVVAEDFVLEALDNMIHERVSRAAAPRPATTSTMPAPSAPQLASAPPPPRKSVSVETKTTTTTAAAAPRQASGGDDDEDPPEDCPKPPQPQLVATRDAGVSDEVWHQLELDKAAEAQRRRDLESARARAVEAKRKLTDALAATTTADGSDGAATPADPSRLDALRKLEAARLEFVRAEQERIEREERQRKELELKVRLMKSGRCPAGFDWIQQSNGFRCGGGSHFKSNDELGIQGA